MDKSHICECTIIHEDLVHQNLVQPKQLLNPIHARSGDYEY